MTFLAVFCRPGFPGQGGRCQTGRQKKHFQQGKVFDRIQANDRYKSHRYDSFLIFHDFPESGEDMIRKIKLIHILLFSFTITTVALIGIILGSWRVVSSESEESIQDRMRNMLSDTVAAVEERITGLEDGSRIAGSYSEIRDFMAGDEQVRFRLKNSVRAELASLVYYESGAVGAYLRTADGAELSACPESASFQSIIPYRVNLQVFRDYQTDQPFRRPRVTKCYHIGDNRFYAVLTPLYPEQSPPTDSNYLGSLILIMDFDAMWESIPDSAQGNVLVEDAAGTLLDNERVRTKKTETGENAVMSAPVRNTDWTVTVSSGTGSNDGALSRIGRICVIFGASSVILLILLLLVQYRHIVEPIQKLTEQVDNVDPETSAVTVPDRGFAELRTLSDSMNGMLGRLRLMNEQMVNDRLRYYEDRITFLQAQINPHSLYNNFECIRGMAAQGANDEIREMTTCLARIYRYCCKGETRVSLAEEAGCLTYYRRVLELRYGGAYRIETGIAPETQDALIPRMILQPLAENAVQHGMIAPGKTQGTVTVTSAAVNGRLILKVMDDGAGMDPETLSRYNSTIALHDDGTHSHIGITNVLRRLNMIYRQDDRENAGMLARFENRPEGGLCITIDIPLIVT